ncbi:hypothetical protein K474DRAFT_1666780 [Panus rudis PR-1116 ss-1]|nr:hypothetical protein K474DRAFT_1666780 [Panus rudis PR-1116 ss-1]
MSLLVGTHWQLVRDLANFLALEKLAAALQKGSARYLLCDMLQGTPRCPPSLQELGTVALERSGITPPQRPNLDVLYPDASHRSITRTPRSLSRDGISHSTHPLNSKFRRDECPPTTNYVFSALYIGTACVVYKYKLLFVSCKTYELRGQAWQVTSVHLIWASSASPCSPESLSSATHGLGSPPPSPPPSRFSSRESHYGLEIHTRPSPFEYIYIYQFGARLGSAERRFDGYD